MKKKSLSVLIALSLTATTLLPAASVFADTTAATPVTTAPASTYGVEYEGHVQNIGWQTPVITTGDQTDISNVTEAGTDGQSLRVEAVKITGTNLPAGASITYQAQVQNKGWMTPVTTTGNTAIDSAAEAGTDGQGLRVETFKMTLNGLPGYAIKYQTHVQNIGWQDAVTTANGTDINSAAIAGTVGQGLRMEAVKIEIVKTDAEKAAEVAAINAVQTAEASKSYTDVTAATTAVKAVQDTAENAALTARINAINVNLAVVSVSPINAAQLQVVFDKAVDPTTVISNGKLINGAVALQSVSGTGAPVVDGSSLASLSADGKTLTITAHTGAFNKASFVATVTGVKDTAENAMSQYVSDVITANDTTAPAIASTTQIDASDVNVNFSEPLLTQGNWTFKLANGTDVTGDVAVSTANIAKGYVGLTLNGNIPAGSIVTGTVVGATDYAGNLINPNPTTVTVTKGQLDGVAPTVASVTSTGLGSFDVKFSKAVEGLSATSITVDGAAATATPDATDSTLYHVTTAAVAAGLHTVAITPAGITDLSGDAFAAYSKVVDFEETAPTLVSSKVQKDNTGNEYLYLTFSKAVTPVAAKLTSAAFTEVNNHVTGNGTLNLSGLTATDATNTVYKVQLSSIATSLTPSTLDQGASYAVTLDGAFTDGTDPIGATTINFARGTDTATTAQTVTGAIATGNSTVKVSFGQNVDPVTATNIANYSIPGVTITNATVKAGDLSNVYLTLAPGSNTLSGTRAITVSGVNSVTGTSLASAWNGTVALTENVAPTVTSATLTSVTPNATTPANSTSVITLKFSKPIANTGTADFNVYVGGVATTAAITEAVSADGTTVTLTLTGATAALTPAQVASGIVVKPATSTITDTDLNALNFTSINVAQN
jgi:uncharacterized protein YjdB